MLQPVHGQQDTFEQKMTIHTTKQWLKLSMNILRTLTATQASIRTRSLRPLSHPYSFRERTEKSIVLLSRHRGFRFPQSNTPCLFRLQTCFKPVNGS
ncbi:hypothetical protein TNCT_403371 [Trichonephila clavata]|uniref:Uncharacterized protein n=1 Tax=Trichonephila clavata TaxID=2740835 RepID=A0A8X6LRT9_TRICU|nr:hypothetical protein TNCT_403371 [Trichonephila clavata]